MNKNNKITNLDDADFISFLYSERDRENNLSQYQGWNNWALIGAFMTIVCAGYAILKDANTFNWNDVFYYSTGILSFFLIYHSWSRAFKRERGVDFYKVRTLSEIAPKESGGTGTFIHSLYTNIHNIFPQELLSKCSLS